MHVEQIGQGAFVLVKQMLVERGARHHFALVQGQILDQRVFARRQRHFLAAPQNLPRPGVNHNFTHRQHIARPARAPPDQRPQPREQFRQIERLDHVIVRARVQPAHAVLGLVARRQHQDRRFFGLAQLAQNLPAVHFGQHHVQHHRVVIVILRVEQPRFALGRRVHGVTLLLQGLGQAVEQIRLIFHN